MVGLPEQGSALAEVLRRRTWAPISPQFHDFVGPALLAHAAHGIAEDRRKRRGPPDRDDLVEGPRERLGVAEALHLGRDVWNASVRDALDPAAGAVDRIVREVHERGEAERVLFFVRLLAERKRAAFPADLREVVLGLGAADGTPDSTVAAGAPQDGGLRIDARPAQGLDALPAGHPALRAMLHPCLAALLEREEMSDCGLVLAAPESPPADRHDVALEGRQGRSIAWRAPELGELATGTLPAPAGAVLDEARPPELAPLFDALERALLRSNRLPGGPPTDQALLGILGLVRRRAEGRSHGPLFDVLWQHAAFELALNEYSRAELEAVLLSLERTVRAQRDGPGSRNAVDALLRDVLIRRFGSEEFVRTAVEGLALGAFRAPGRVR